MSLVLHNTLFIDAVEIESKVTWLLSLSFKLINTLSLFFFSFLISADIGPFSTAAGIMKSHFTKGTDEPPQIKEFTNGLVLELYSYFCKEMKFSLRALARKLIKFSGESVHNSNITKYICR